MDKKTPTDRANVWQERFGIARDNQDVMFKRFASWYDLFYATVTDANISPWRSKVFIPVLTSKGWSMISKMVGLEPGFDATVRDPDMAPEELKDKASKASLKLRYDYTNPRLDEPIRDKLVAPLVDSIVTGTGFAKVPWRVCSKNVYSRDIPDNGVVDLTKQNKKKQYYGMNDLIPVNIFNVFVAPTATSLYKAPWLIIKEYKTLDELKSVVDIKGKPLYSNLDQLSKARQESDEFATYKKSRNRLTSTDDPISADSTLDHLAIYECYDYDNTIYTYASGGTKDSKDNWVEIRKQADTYWHEKFPLVQFKMKQRPYEFWGEGIFETTERLQSAINDVFNHYMDNVNLSVDGMLMIDSNSEVGDYFVEPGGEIRYQGTEPKQFKFPEPNPQQIQTVNNMLEKAIEDVTISSYATGLPNSATDTTAGTATGIMRLQQAAGDLMSFFRDNFQQSIHQVGEMWLSNNQQFMDQDVTIETKDNVTNDSVTITPKDMQGDIDIQVNDSSMEPLTKDEQKQARVMYNQQVMALQAASMQQFQATGIPPIDLNFTQMLSDLASDFGQTGVDKLIVPQQEAQQAHQMQAQQQQATMQAQAKPTQQPSSPLQKVAESINFKDLPGDAQQALLTQVGLPSEEPTPAQTQQVSDQITNVHKLHDSFLNTMQRAGQIPPEIQQAMNQQTQQQPEGVPQQ